MAHGSVLILGQTASDGTGGVTLGFRRLLQSIPEAGRVTGTGLAALPALNRGHWEIDNLQHHVRDVSCDEDSLCARNKSLAGNLACLANAAISTVRLKGRFAHMPQANRHYAARQGEVLPEVTRPG